MEKIMYSPSFLRLEKNNIGSDFVVGDIHGNYTELMERLERIKFNKETDRLIAVGDLVDRGTENEQVMDLLLEDWFFSVVGNHDLMMLEYLDGNILEKDYIRDGGEWFIKLPRYKQEQISGRVYDLPLAIEIETDDETIGVVHAEVPFNDWSRFKQWLISDDQQNKSFIIKTCIWDRYRIENNIKDNVIGVDRIYCGHSTTRTILNLGNVYYIDTKNFHNDSPISILQIQGIRSFWLMEGSK